MVGEMAKTTDMKLDHILSICSTLETLILHGFGPNGLNTMLSTPTGQLMISNNSWSILNSINLSHPLGKMVVNAIKNHIQTFGDGGKSFVLILVNIFRDIELQNQNSGLDSQQQTIIIGLNKLRHEIPQLLRGVLSLSSSFDLSQATVTSARLETLKLIRTQLEGSFPMLTAEHLTHIFVTFLFDKLTNVQHLPAIVLDVIRNFDTCYLEAVGYPPSSSQVIEGFVIQRDFLAVAPDLSSFTNVRFVLLNCNLDGDISETPAVFNVTNELVLRSALQHKTKITSGVIRRLNEDGVKLIISSVKISSAERLACHVAGISSVHMVEDEEMTRLSMLFGIHAVNLLHEYLAEPLSFVGKVFKCGYVILGGHRYVHLIPNSSDIYINKHSHISIMKQFLLTGHSKGVCCDMRVVLKNCLKYIHHWLTADVMHISNDDLFKSKKAATIASGGNFELRMYTEINSNVNQCNDADYANVCQTVARALLQIPVTLLRNSYHTKARTMSIYRILDQLHAQHPGDLILNAKSGELVNACDSHQCESLVSKVAMLYNVIDAVIQILRIDQLVPVTNKQIKDRA